MHLNSSSSWMENLEIDFVFLTLPLLFKFRCILFYFILFPLKIGYEEEVMIFPFHKRKVKTISMKPPIFGEFYIK